MAPVLAFFSLEEGRVQSRPRGSEGTSASHMEPSAQDAHDSIVARDSMGCDSGALHALAARPPQTQAGGGGLTTAELQVIMFGLCLKPEVPATVNKLRDLLQEQLTWDAAFVRCVGDDGGSPLHYAAKANNYKIAELLVTTTNIRLTCRDNDDRLPLHYAIQNYNIPLIDLLLQRCPQRLLTHDVFHCSGAVGGGETLLHHATRIDVSARAPVVERLVLLGADPLQRNDEGVRPYDIAKDRGLCSAFYFNNYLLNRTISEDRFDVKPEDIDDDEVRVRQHRDGFIPASDGYSAAERKLIKYNPTWWHEGIALVHNLTAYVMQ